MSYSFKVGPQGPGFYTCGCGGKPKLKAVVPEGSKAVRYVTAIRQQVAGVSGQQYQIQPAMLLLDAKIQDADAWIAAGMAVVPTEQEQQGMNGYLGRLG